MGSMHIDRDHKLAPGHSRFPSRDSLTAATEQRTSPKVDQAAIDSSRRDRKRLREERHRSEVEGPMKPPHSKRARHSPESTPKKARIPEEVGSAGIVNKKADESSQELSEQDQMKVDEFLSEVAASISKTNPLFPPSSSVISSPCPSPRLRNQNVPEAKGVRPRHSLTHPLPRRPSYSVGTSLPAPVRVTASSSLLERVTSKPLKGSGIRSRASGVVQQRDVEDNAEDQAGSPAPSAGLDLRPGNPSLNGASAPALGKSLASTSTERGGDKVQASSQPQPASCAPHDCPPTNSTSATAQDADTSARTHLEQISRLQELYAMSQAELMKERVAKRKAEDEMEKERKLRRRLEDVLWADEASKKGSGAN
ncbi:hypothetical protein DL93DRAFT_230367 [Clavulina sp. PMI_390]|nr:hypothetical protein DL93DRAFT_230367 [Clavulina sp. PMI_390]